MLTDTQITTATTEELKALSARITAEIGERDRAHRQRRHEEREREQREEREAGQGYRWEQVACGHADRCLKCKSGERHGPYLYRYFRKDGKQKSEYVPLAQARELAAKGVVAPRPSSVSPV